jgi:hypothetical protein
MRSRETGTAPVNFFRRHGLWSCRFLAVVFLRPNVRGVFVSRDGFGRRLKGNNMNELLILLGFFAVYLLLQIYVLPKAGIST